MTDNNANITTIRTLLEAYYSGSLDAAGEVRLRQLLEETAPLPADLEEERQLMRLTSEAMLSLLDEEDVPEGLEDTLRADIHRRAVADGHRRSWRRWLYAGAAAAVAAVMVTVAVLAPGDGSSDHPMTAQTGQTSAPAPAQSPASSTRQNMIASADTPTPSPATPKAAPKAAPKASRKASRIETAQPLPRQEEDLTAETTPSLTDEETQQMMLLGEELAQVRQLMLANNEEIESEFSTTIDEAGISRSACMTEVFASGGRRTDAPDNYQEYLNP